MSAQKPSHHPPRRIGVVAESVSGETRVAATPATVRLLLGLGYEVVVESGAGEASGFGDQAYADAGAGIGEAWDADVVLKVNAPSDAEICRLRKGATVVALLTPAQKPELLQALADAGVTALALDAVPRISRAQSMDVLSSMANIAGYRAVIEAAHAFGRFFTGQVTAAGKVPPAKVLVAGAGVAGLAAIGAASSLGAIVRATDPRPEVADQVKSLGGEYLPVEAVQESSTDGYAKATSADYDRAAAQLYHEQAEDVDMVITTALIPGRPAPRLLTAEDVAVMKSGSVIVDMAAAMGGNVEGTVPGRTVVTDNGVTIIGYTDLASRLPAQASQLFGTNLLNLLKLLTPGKDGQLTVDFDDVVQRAVTVVRDGDVTWPPPPVAVSAAPAAQPAAAPVAPEPKQSNLTPAWRFGLIGLGMLAMFLLVAFAPTQLAGNFTVFALAVVIGYYVIGKVHHALHTPLMSVTNAISGIVVIGALLQIGHESWIVTTLSFVAILLTSVNIFGGFAVTRRMLSMFSKG
ncbi:NAD(P) transhydrogenase subunit alpha [Streptomyces avermitilis]|uniref:NAD(P) transhydrogenase subunit alpha n=1 Tax=Streptomyces avermitilis (strain ATCC 31267 / DSM 46492 / JCM 5070 / NBRC 14893 / NCIMB 12804 / NRRL 8165 / MA-4680) TaxID=227882 RepID=Q82QU1_STRAW|nr:MULTISPECIES: Re/Si-specific NAD(P)(+) transhydrogenase subunit alpha [Streptomyces]KUN51092.1 NAD(P) transhydrogenase subunit alpha [Streptomyces avermitilis]MYS96102.1 Re/Si-specific NAD(P)(+) transhydrogenase subunit alpha [Streptomyces sp. SID5469]OOV17910.1 NAD(P) transhydrogenase subunit alpha [Streptomyces avermitilis]BAC68113.1 putative pyridine nucleotide transhydrogenase, alpha subunit [Streptomyces avermitilis MA-4680 = NBRC 14893]